MQRATRISVCVIAVSKSHEFLLKVRRLSKFFSTPTPSRRRVVIFSTTTQGMTWRRVDVFSTTSDTSRKVLLMSAACVSEIRSVWSFPTKQHRGSFLWVTLWCINFAETEFPYRNIVHQLILSLRCAWRHRHINHWKIQSCIVFSICYK